MSDATGPPRAANPPAGFACLRCGQLTRVRWTETVSSRIVRRRRVCPGCGYRFSTAERPVTPPATDAATGGG